MARLMTTYQDSFKHPFLNRFIKSSQQPELPRPLPRPVGDIVTSATADLHNCNCDCNNYDPVTKKQHVEFNHAGGEGQLKKLCTPDTPALNEAGESSRLENECALWDDDIMKSVYQVDYFREGYSRVPHTADDCESSPIAVSPEKAASNNDYQDPFQFRVCCVKPKTTMSSSSNKCQGSTKENYWKKFGKSEYMDTISKYGYINLMSMQQYRRANPSSILRPQ